MHFSIYVLVLVSFLTWLVFVMTAVKIYKFFSEFEKFKSTNDVELNSMVWHLKKLEGDIAEIIVELRRSNKLLYEMRGAGEFPDEVRDFHMDSDVFRQEKVSEQNLKRSKSASEIDVLQKSPPDRTKIESLAENITQNPKRSVNASQPEVDVPLKRPPVKTGIESLAENITQNPKRSANASQPEADAPLKRPNDKTEIESLGGQVTRNSKDTSIISPKA